MSGRPYDDGPRPGDQDGARTAVTARDGGFRQVEPTKSTSSSQTTGAVGSRESRRSMMPP